MTKQSNELVFKTHADKGSSLEFVMSDETPDLMDDIILSDGWDLENFEKNPIALFGHSSAFPIGKWKNVEVKNKQLRGELELAPKGTSPRIDEIINLIEAGILRAVSVGFRPTETKPRPENDGYFYVKQRLIETSLVSVPANPNALLVARSLKTSPATIDLVFAEHGAEHPIRRRELTGEHAASVSRISGKGSAMSLAQRIIDLEAQIVSKRDQLELHLDNQNDSNVSDDDLETTARLNAELTQLERTRASLIDSEKALAGRIDPATSRSRALSTTVLTPETARTSPAAPAIVTLVRKELDPVDYIVRAATVSYMAKTSGKTEDEIRQRMYGEDPLTKVVCDLVTRAASAPALTTVTGWALELAQTTYTALMPLLMPNGILPRLATRGLTLAFGTAGRIVIPTRSRTPSLAGSFVGEGMPIPVRQGAFTSQTLTPKKMAVITTWTREMNDHSQPAIEGLLRDAIQQDTAVAVDTVLLDANAATVIRPAGLLNGVAAITATAITNGALAAIVGDIANMVSAITTSTYGNVRNLVWLMNPTDVLRAGLISAANTGLFPFREELARGMLANIPVIDSATVPTKVMILVDAADFVVAGGGAPRMEMSDQATLHMEDTTPLDLVASPSTVAAPQRSLFQTDSLALRMVLPLNWVQRRAGTIAWTQAVTW